MRGRETERKGGGDESIGEERSKEKRRGTGGGNEREREFDS